MPIIRDQLTPSSSVTVGSVSWDNVQKDALNNLRVFASSYSDGLLHVPQAILAGGNTNGVANFLIAGTGLQAVLTASGGAPVIISFAGGYDIQGLVVYHAKITANTNINGLTANTTNFCFVDYNTGTGAVTVGFTVVAPTYSVTAPSSPTTASYWFNPVSMSMFNWNGAGWVKKNAVFVGEVVTGASSVTSAKTYGLKREIRISQALAATGTEYTVSHNFGTNLVKVECQFECSADDIGYVVGNIANVPYSYGTSNIGVAITLNGRNDIKVRTASSGIGTLIHGTGGTLSNMTTGKWNAIINVVRSF